MIIFKYFNHNFFLIWQQDPDAKTMEWPTAEELNLALPPPIQDVQALSLVLSISNVTVTLFIKAFCQMFLLLKSVFNV